MAFRRHKWSFVLSAVLTAAALMAVLSLAVSEDCDAASSGTCGDNLTWNLDDSGNLTISGQGSMDDFKRNGPWGTSGIKSVTIENGVASIGSNAFNGCASLSSVSIPDSVASIGNYAFSGCKSLSSVSIPDSVRSVGYSAFNGCKSLKSISLGYSVTFIENKAFDGCPSLASISVSSDNETYSSEDGVLFDKNKTALITYPAGKQDAEYSIPDSVECVMFHAFYGCPFLESINIPGSVISMEAEEGEAFDGCPSLASISVSPDNENYSSADGVLFDKNKTALVRYPEGKQDFRYEVPESVTYFIWGAFKNSNLVSVTITGPVKVIG